jgi:hypothetical protein
MSDLKKATNDLFLAHHLAMSSPVADPTSNTKAKPREIPSDTADTSDSPGNEESAVMLGKGYRRTAYIDHVEFSPTTPSPEHNPFGYTYVDGLRKPLRQDKVRVCKMYRKYIGLDAQGRERFLVGDYVGNRRDILDNQDAPENVGATWTIFLQEDKDLGTPIRKYHLCDLEPVTDAGYKLVKPNDYKPKKPALLAYQTRVAPPKPKLGFPVKHPVYGGGVVVRVTGTGERWYAAIAYGWERTDVFPPLGTSVRRAMPAPNDDYYYVYGDVAELREDKVIVSYENGQSGLFDLEEFFKRFRRCHEISSTAFHEVLNLERPNTPLRVNFRRLDRDTRTHNERVMAAQSRSSMAISALISRNTPDSGHFVHRDRADGPAFNPGHSFRWHRERQEAPKNEDFAPLVGRPKKVAKKRKGWSWDRLNAVREKLAAQAEEPTHTPPEEPEPIWDRHVPPAEPEQDEPTLGDADDVNGRVALF